jgi:hypothetical protein
MGELRLGRAGNALSAATIALVLACVAVLLATGV